MNKFEQKEMEKKRPSKNTRYDWLINYIPRPIRKFVGHKDKVVNLFKTNTPKDYGKQVMYGRGKKPIKPKTQNQSEKNIIKSIKNLFKLKKENEAIKNTIIRNFRTLFEQENYYYIPIRVGNF